MLGADFWERERDNLRTVLLPFIQQMVIAGSKNATGRLDGQFGIRIDDTLARADAAQWARQFTDELLSLVGATNERVVGEIVATWIETPGAILQDLNTQLRQVLDVDETRAASIAATETTRAFARGEDLSNQAAGLPSMAVRPPGHPKCRCFTSTHLLAPGQWVVTWQTRRDELVCVNTRIATPWGSEPGCRGMHQKVISQGPYLGMDLAQAKREARRA